MPGLWTMFRSDWLSASWKTYLSATSVLQGICTAVLNWNSILVPIICANGCAEKRRCVLPSRIPAHNWHTINRYPYWVLLRWGEFGG
jgi:hypothetical protein